MATTPQGDDTSLRSTVMAALTRAVARQQMATTSTSVKKPKKLSATYSVASVAPRTMRS